MLKVSREEEDQESELSEEVIAGRFVSRWSDESGRVINLENSKEFEAGRLALCEVALRCGWLKRWQISQ
jgi:hypothetical protein